MVAQIVKEVFASLMLLTWNMAREEDLKPGDHVYTNRLYGLYTHHGIYVGEGYVIHFTRNGVKKTCLDCFRQEGKKLHRIHSYAYGRPLLEYRLARWGTCTTLPAAKSPQEVVNKARRLQEADAFGEYDLINNNCEHFALFCQTSVPASAQTVLLSICKGKIEKLKEWGMKFLQKFKCKLPEHSWYNRHGLRSGL